MSRLLINQHIAEVNRLRAVSGGSLESIVSEAFKDRLKQWARGQGLIFLSQAPLETGMKTRIVPDAASVHEIRVPLGHWEAKDTEDGLDAEIEKKRRRGYPTDNIVFEDRRTAALYQDGREVARCAMTDVDALLRLLVRISVETAAIVAATRAASAPRP